MLVFHVKLAECGVGCTPAPDSAILAGEFVALLTALALPVELPVAAGLKITLKPVLCPAARVNGNGRPLAL